MKFDRNIIPSPSEIKPFIVPEDEKFELENGLQIYHVKKSDLPIVLINVVINSGSKFDPVNKKGTFNLLSMCIDEGAGEFNSLELSEQFDLLGISFSIYCNSDNIQIKLQTLKENFNKAMGLLAKVLVEPHLKVDDFEREKRKILTRLKQLQDDPEYLANVSFESILLGDKNPYSFPVLGYEKNIDKIVNDDINLNYRNFVLPNNSFVIATGDIDKNELVETFNKNLSGWDSNNFKNYLQIEDKNDIQKVYIVGKEDSVQTEIRIGQHSSGRNSKDYFAKHLMNTTLGGQFTSRINLNLREKHGYTYGAGSNFNYYKENAYFSVYTSVGIEDTNNALIEIFRELHNIRKGVSEEELNFAKSSIVRKFPSNFETYKQITSNIAGKIIFNLADDYFRNYIENINSITLEDVNKAAVENIFPDRMTTILVGDKIKLLEQLKSSEFGEVEVYVKN